MNLLQKLILPAIYLLAAIIIILIIRAWKSRSMPDLYPWHTISIGKELLVENNYENIDTYLKEEDAYIRDLFAKVKDSAKGNYNRFNPKSKAYPLLREDNLNASFVYDPGKKNTKGVILLLHGLSDSPYHMRALGKLFKEEGLYVLGLRLPGHGTLPSGLLDVTWQEWAKATEWGAGQLQSLAIERGDVPLYMGGFSTGGALVLNYAFKALSDNKLHKPEKLFLFSPAVGVSKMARFAGWHKSLSWMNYFNKFSWLDVLPEYDPAKYNSFTKNAGRQIYLLTMENNDLIQKIANGKRQSELPSIISFQSMVDATVIPKDLLEMYNEIGTTKDALFVFDVNRVYADFIQDEALQIDPRKISFAQTSKPQLHMLINSLKSDSILGANASGVYKQGNNGELVDVYPEYHLSWPKEFFAISHVAVPISPEDEIYGSSSTLGTMSVHGEQDVLLITPDAFMRIRYNPFFELMEMEIKEFLKN